MHGIGAGYGVEGQRGSRAAGVVEGIHGVTAGKRAHIAAKEAQGGLDVVQPRLAGTTVVGVGTAQWDKGLRDIAGPWSIRALSSIKGLHRD